VIDIRRVSRSAATARRACCVQAAIDAALGDEVAAGGPMRPATPARAVAATRSA
jgi:hypothetical protein